MKILRLSEAPGRTRWIAGILASLSLVALVAAPSEQGATPTAAPPVSGADPAERPGAPENPPPAAEETPPKEPSAILADRAAAWERASLRLQQADREAGEASLRQIKKFDEFIAERKAGAEPFADEILGLEAKFTGLLTVFDEIGSALGQLVGNAPEIGSSRMEWSIRDSFIQHVLNRDLMSKALNLMVSEYVGELKEIEARLLIDLRVDLGDDAIPDGDAPFLNEEIGHAIVVWDDQAIHDAVAGDFWLSIGKYAAAEVAGNVVADSLAGGIEHDATRVGAKAAVGIAAGGAVASGLDHALSAVGIEPRRDIIAGVNATLDRIRGKVVEGDTEAVEAYRAFSLIALHHPDPESRRACADAVAAIEKHTSLGMRFRLWKLAADRGRRVVSTLAARTLGPGASIALQQQYAHLDPERCDPPAEIVRKARAWVAQFEGDSTP